MAIRELPARPNLEHLKNQAHALQRQGLASDASATARFVAFGITATAPKLARRLPADPPSLMGRISPFFLPGNWLMEQRYSIAITDATRRRC